MRGTAFDIIDRRQQARLNDIAASGIPAQSNPASQTGTATSPPAATDASMDARVAPLTPAVASAIPSSEVHIPGGPPTESRSGAPPNTLGDQSRARSIHSSERAEGSSESVFPATSPDWEHLLEDNGASKSDMEATRGSVQRPGTTATSPRPSPPAAQSSHVEPSTVITPTLLTRRVGIAEEASPSTLTSDICTSSADLPENSTPAE